VKSSGISAVVGRSSIAPASDILRTIQGILLPPNSIVAALKMR
jgi:hypothetical protein